MQQKKFWQSGSTLESRVKAVQNINDPAILSDDVQRWSKLFLTMLLVFTTFLGAFSYFKFFENSFGFYAAAAMAVVLSITIEWGKNWGSLKFLRMWFFVGMDKITANMGLGIMFACVALLSATTFFASVSNSTKGAEVLSLVLADEKNERDGKAYDPGTQDIDAQILAVQKSISDAKNIKYKGETTYQAQRSIQSQSKALDKLYSIKQSRENGARADFDSRQKKLESRDNFKASTLLLVGGFVELLQIILLLLRVSSEKNLEDFYSKKTVPQSPQHKSANFSTQNQETPAFESHQNTAFGHSKPSIGFKWDGYGQNKENAVPQSPQHFLQKFPDVCDKILLGLKSTFQKEVPNFYRHDANPDTVYGRIGKELLKIQVAINMPGFSPSYEVASKVLDYLQGVGFPALISAKKPYPGDIEILQKLSEIVEKARIAEN
jgi:hypothetical protein